MSRILLISMYYEPLNLIPVPRIKMFREALIEGGNMVDVMTRSYSERQLSKSHLGIATDSCMDKRVVEDINGVIYYFPFQKQNNKKKISNMLPPGVRGRYNMRQIDVFHHDFYDRVIDQIKKASHQYDVVFLSYGPPIILKIAKYFIEKTDSKVVLDFRDSYITEADSGYLLKKKTQILDSILPKVHCVTAASSGIIEIMKNRIKSEFRIQVIWNGLLLEEESKEKNTLQKIEEIQKNDTLIALHAGSLYPGQDMTYFEKLFGNLDDVSIESILLGANDEVKDLDKFKRYPKVSPNEAYEICKIANLLLLPVWQNRYTGFSGKLLTYLHSGSHIICGPNPQEDLRDALSTSNNTHILTGNLEADKKLIIELIKTGFKSRDYDKTQYEATAQFEKIQGLL